MRQSKEDNKRTKLVREIPYIDSKELVATDGSANGRDPSPPARSRPSGASWNQQTERDRLRKFTSDREF